MGVKDTIGNVTSNVLNTVMGSGIFQPVHQILHIRRDKHNLPPPLLNF